MGSEEVLQPFNLNGVSLELYTVPGRTFQPNQTTNLVYGAVEVQKGDWGIEIGSGIGPGTIYLAQQSHLQVLYSVEAVREQCEVQRKNIDKYNLETKVRLLEGSLFEPLKQRHETEFADFIVSDVSGMTDIGVKLGWYPENVPCGGVDGTDNIATLLAQAPEYLDRVSPNARVYFPIVVQFSNGQKIRQIANDFFHNVQLKKSQDLPLSKEQWEVLQREEYAPFAPFKERGSRKLWTLEVYEARSPK